MKQTTIEEVILKINDAKENFPELGFHPEFIRGLENGFKMALFILREVGRPAFKEEILKAYAQGYTDSENATEEAKFLADVGEFHEPENYYNQTYLPYEKD